MTISVYDIFSKNEEIERRETTFKMYSEVLPVECDRAARTFKELGDIIKKVISGGATDLPESINSLSFLTTLYYFQEKTLEIERLFYKFRSICLDDSKKKDSLYESLYKKLCSINKDLQRELGKLPSHPNSETQKQEIADAIQTITDSSNVQTLDQPAPYYTRTSTSTL